MTQSTRARMVADLELANYSSGTVYQYLRCAVSLRQACMNPAAPIPILGPSQEVGHGWGADGGRGAGVQGVAP